MDKPHSVLPALLAMLACLTMAHAADVANRRSTDVNGTLPSRVALSTLLVGTGLEFSRVGDETVAIRSAGPGAMSDAAMSKSARPDPGTSAIAPSQLPADVVLAPRPPADQELAGNSLYRFIEHHATTHYIVTGAARNLARWRGGRQSICPETRGLTAAENAFVTARLRAVAAYVGAPVQSDPRCKSNILIRFTNNPQAAMNDVFKWATVYFRNRYNGGSRELIKFRGGHAIQGWYMTTTGDSQVLNTEPALLRLSLLPVWPQLDQKYLTSDSEGGGSGSGIGVVILTVDVTKVGDETIGTISDYLAMLTLSVAQSPDHCDPLPSILDLQSTSCGTRPRPAAMTSADLAFLKALYYLNTGLGPSLSLEDIQVNMLRQFKHR
jgi:hypothetical protein